jgi:hypothetical protein
MMYGEKGIITCDVYGKDPKIYYNNGDVETFEEKEDKKALPENGHHAAWVEACKAGFKSKEHKKLTSSFDFAGPLTENVLMGNLAIRSYAIREKNQKNRFTYPGRKKLLWDGENMKITNFEGANQYVKREYRDGWSL